MCSRTAVAADADSGPGACGSASPSIERTGCTSRSDEARKASLSLGEVVARRDPFARVGDREQCSASDRVEDAVAQRRCVQRAVEDVEERGRRAFEHASVGADEQRLVGTLLAGQARGEHVPAVGERLDAVEHACRRVGDRLQRDRLREGRQPLEHPDPPPAAGHDESQHPVLASAWVASRRVGVGADRVGVERQAQGLGAARHAVDVLLHAERPAGVEANDLEDAVAAQQALVGDGDLRFGDVHDVPSRIASVRDMREAYDVAAARPARVTFGSAPPSPPGPAPAARAARAGTPVPSPPP